jgi:hypothetical protein
MGIMKKVAPVALALGLGARALFGNPLETTIVKEDNKSEMVDFTADAGNKGFALDLSLPVPGDWNLNFASDVTFAETSSPPRVNNVDFVLGRDNFYLGASYGDLSTETLLQGSNIFKVQWGMKPADWIDFSVTGAIVNIPNNTVDISSMGYPKSQIPLTLYAAGENVNMGQKFALNSNWSMFPWLSIVASEYFANPQINDDFQTMDALSPGFGAQSMGYSFDHLNVKGGVDFDFNEHIKLSYQGTYEGQFYPSFNLTNMVGVQFHDKDKMNLAYDVSLITKPTWAADGVIDPTRNELQFDINGFYLTDFGLYVKGDVSALVNFLTENQFNVTAGVGWKFKDGSDIEAYFNSQFNPEDASQNNSVGILYSTKLDKSVNKESKTRNAFVTSPGISKPNITYSSSPSLAALHAQFGSTLEEAVSNVHSEQDLSRLASLITWTDHDGTYSAKQEYEQTGSGVCRDTNGNLLPYIEARAFNYRNVRSVVLRGGFISHAVVAIETKDGKFDLRNYDQFYELNAPTAQAAVDAVFPGSYIYDDGTTSTSVQTVRNAVERPLYDWTKFNKD